MSVFTVCTHSLCFEILSPPPFQSSNVCAENRNVAPPIPSPWGRLSAQGSEAQQRHRVLAQG